MKAVYGEGRRRMERGVARRGEWCVGTRRLMCEMGMEEWWMTEVVGDDTQWKCSVGKMVQAREEVRWRGTLSSCFKY